MQDENSNEFAKDFQSARDALKAFHAVKDSDAQFEALCEHPFSAAQVAQMIRQCVPSDDPVRMTADQKDFWNRFMEELGSDYFEGLRVCVAFGRKAQEF